MSIRFSIGTWLMLSCLGLAQAQFELDAENDTTALLNLKLYTPDDKPYANAPVLFEGIKAGRRYEAKTDAKGEIFEQPLHIGDSYLIRCGETVASQRVEVQKVPFAVYELEAYTERTLILKFVYTDLGKQPLADEVVTARSLKTGRRFEAKTNNKGEAQFYLPLEGEYTFAVAYQGEVGRYKVKDPQNDQEKHTLRYSWIGTKAHEARLAADKAAQEAREAELAAFRQKIKDGIGKLPGAKTSAEVEQWDLFLDLELLPKDFLSEQYPLKAKSLQDLSKNNAALFKKERPVLAALSRIQARSPKLLVSTHLAQYGGPRYLEDLMLFYLMPGNSCRLLLFSETAKGSSNLLYQTPGKPADLVEKGMATLKGQTYNYRHLVGDMLAAQSKAQADEEMVFIINNFATPVDLHEVSKIKKPLRLILGNFTDLQPGQARAKRLVCDMGQMRATDLNTAILDLAYQTKGSVHTGLLDLWDIHKTQEGEILKLNGEQYQLQRGKFVNLTIKKIE